MAYLLSLKVVSLMRRLIFAVYPRPRRSILPMTLFCLLMLSPLVWADSAISLSNPVSNAQSLLNTQPSQAVRPTGGISANRPEVTSYPYLLAPLDQLDISVQGHEDLHQTVTILGDGTFHYPVAGKIVAAGKTVDELEAVLTTGLIRYCKDPQVTVLVREAHPRKISVAGAVKSPGLYDFRPGMRVLELIAASGGPVETPERTEATLVTDQGTHATPVDLVKLMKDGDTTQNLTLSSGDVLLLSPRDPATSMIQVVGEVAKPGQYDVLPSGTTVLSILTQAGGATPDAALTQVQIMHAGQVRAVNLHPLKYNLNDAAGKLSLVAGDTLLVPENKAKIAVLGEVRVPSVYRIPDGESLPITQALAQAGGPTEDGDKKQIGILRLGSDNKRQLIAVNMDQLLRGDARVVNMELQPGDILVVPSRHKGHNMLEYLSQIPGIYTLTHL